VVAGLGLDGQVYVRVTEPSGTFHDWAAIPGKTFPSDVASGYNSAAWSAWSAIPNGLFTSGPAMVASSTTLAFVARGGDAASPYIDEEPLSPFRPAGHWNKGGGGASVYSSALSTSQWSSLSHVDVFGLGGDNHIWVDSSDAGAWAGTIQVCDSTTMCPRKSTTFASRPAAYSWGVGHIDVVARADTSAPLPLFVSTGPFYVNTYQD
jgi:hypothetical protein